MGITTFDKIPRASDDASIAELLFRSWRQGGISNDDYYIGSASWVADNADKYPPAPYPLLADHLRNYATARVVSDRTYDPTLHKKMGMWFALIMRVQTGNLADYEFLVWAMEKCSSVKLTGHVARLRKQIQLFEAVRFPAEDFRIAADSQRRDCDEKQSQARRA